MIPIKVTWLPLTRGAVSHGTHHDSFDDTTGLLGRVDTESHIVNVVERVEDAEDVKTVLDSASGELETSLVSDKSTS